MKDRREHFKGSSRIKDMDIKREDQTLAKLIQALKDAGEVDLIDQLSACARGAPKEWVRWTLDRQVWYLRKIADLTQQELACRAGLVQSHVAKVEAGRDVRVSTLRRLYGAMGWELLLLPHPKGVPFGDTPRPVWAKPSK